MLGMAGKATEVKPKPGHKAEEPNTSDVAIHLIYYLNRPLFSACQSNGAYFNRQRAVTNNRDTRTEEGPKKPPRDALQNRLSIAPPEDPKCATAGVICNGPTHVCLYKVFMHRGTTRMSRGG